MQMNDMQTNGEKDMNKVQNINENPLVRICTFSILHANEFSFELLIDAISMLKKTPLFKHEVKMWLNRADLLRKLYDRDLNSTIASNADYFASTNEKMDEEIEHLEKVFYYSIKQELDNQKIEYSAEIAKLEECNIFMMSSLNAHDEALKLLFKAKVGKINKEYLRLTKVSQSVSNAIKCISGNTVNLDTNRVTTAYNNLMNVFFDPKTIDKTLA